MILIDTGPLVAVLGTKLDFSDICRKILHQTPWPLISTWPCLTEAMYFAWQKGEFELLRLLQDGAVRLMEPGKNLKDGQPPDAFMLRIGELMEQYQDLPMDFADASLVVASERLRIRKILTLDRKDFSIYRAFDGGAFEIVP